jgi:hypothetical protein
MSNVINYAELFSTFLDQMYATESRSYGLLQSNPQVQWINAKTIRIPTIATSGYKDHNRATLAFNTGSIENTWKPMTLDFDRDIELPIDAMDVDETNLVTSLANIQATFEREHAIPESDAYRFSKLFAEFVTLDGEVDTTTLTTANFLKWFDEQMSDMDDDGVPEEGRVLYLTPALNKIAKEAEGITRMLTIGPGANAINRKVYSLDDVNMVKVPSARFKTQYDFTEDFTPIQAAGQISAILLHPSAVVAREKYDYIKLFSPGSDSRVGSAYLYQNRKYQDLFVLSQKVPGIKINATVAGLASS